MTDYKKSFKMYKLAAEQGFEFGQYSIGRIYYDGKGVEVDYKESIKWFKLAADQGKGYDQYRNAPI